jgi:hypothetical protein
MMRNEFRDKEFPEGLDPLDRFGFSLGLEESLIYLCVIVVVSRVFAFVILKATVNKFQ